MEGTLSNNLGNFIAVMEKAVKDPNHMKRYFSQFYDPNSLTKLSSSNRPCGTITNVQPDDYPQATIEIKKFFIGAQVPAIFP